VGVALAAAAVAAVIGLVRLLVRFNDPDVEFPFGSNAPGASMVALKVSGLVLLALFVVLALLAANLLLEHPLRRARRWWSERSEQTS
jgi:hypothetical protein